MITSVFKKSTPINYSIIALLLLVFFFIVQFQETKWIYDRLEIGKKIALFGGFIVSFFLVNFIAKKNGLTKDSGYSILFYFIFLLFFPSVWLDYNLVLANFFILLALRRLVSLQTLKAPKEKIFDASLWIFVASFFNFWCILFLLIVYLSIIFHVSRDYRNWLIPIVAFFITFILFVLYAVVIDFSVLNSYSENAFINLKLDYFSTNYQNFALSVFSVAAVFFIIPAVFSLSNKPLNLQASYKKMIFSFIIGFVIYLISPDKSNNLLIFTFFPMAIFATNSVEFSRSKLQQEIILATSILLGLLTFFFQL